jgi:hypothetical protein
MANLLVLKITIGSNGARVGGLATWNMTVERRYCAGRSTVEMAAAG